MSDERYPERPRGDAGAGEDEPRDTQAAGYPAMPPLAEADPQIRGDDEPVESGWAGAAQVAEDDVDPTGKE
jgi:hypothetical protein